MKALQGFKLKKAILFTCFLSFFLSFSQVSISENHIGKLKRHSKKKFEKIKSSTTVFILSDCIEKSDYVKILNDVWKVTDFILLHEGEFDSSDYLDKNYTFVNFDWIHQTMTNMSGGGSSIVHHFMNFSLFDYDNFVKDFSKIDKNDKLKLITKGNKLYRKNISMFGSINLYPNKEYVDISYNYVNECEIFYNYNLGFLKNYFQKINDLITKSESYWLFDNDYSKNIAILKEKTLLVPMYMSEKYKKNRSNIPISIGKDIKYLEELFSNYNYKFEFIPVGELSARIVSGEDCIYLTFVRSSREKFIQVVNSKTGEILYRNYIADFMSSVNLKPRHINDINKAIQKR